MTRKPKNDPEFKQIASDSNDLLTQQQATLTGVDVNTNFEKTDGGRDEEPVE